MRDLTGRALKARIKAGVKVAKARAPSSTGALRDSIDGEVVTRGNVSTAELGSDSRYARVHELGGGRGIRGKGFLRDGWEAAQDGLDEEVLDGIEREVLRG